MVARYRMSDCRRRAVEKGVPKEVRRNCGRIAMHIPIKDSLSIAWTRCHRAVRDFNRYLLFPSSSLTSLKRYVMHTNGAAAVRMHVTECLASAQVHRFLRESYRDGLRQRKKETSINNCKNFLSLPRKIFLSSIAINSELYSLYRNLYNFAKFKY